MSHVRKIWIRERFGGEIHEADGYLVDGQLRHLEGDLPIARNHAGAVVPETLRSAIEDAVRTHAAEVRWNGATYTWVVY